MITVRGEKGTCKVGESTGSAVEGGLLQDEEYFNHEICKHFKVSQKESREKEQREVNKSIKN